MGILIAALVALVLAHKSASTKAPTTTLSTGVPTGLGTTPMLVMGVLTREANGRSLQTWQNWQTTRGTPVPVGSAADVLAPSTAASDAKINQQTQLGGGLTVINPDEKKPAGSSGQTNVTPIAGGVTSGGGSLSTGGGITHCPIEGTSIESLGGSEVQTNLIEEMNWTIIETDSGHTLTASSSHLLYTRRGLVPISTLTPDDFIVTKKGESRIVIVSTRQRAAKKMAIHVPDGHLYWADGILSHNKAIV